MEPTIPLGFANGILGPFLYPHQDQIRIGPKENISFLVLEKGRANTDKREEKRKEEEEEEEEDHRYTCLGLYGI